jgi:hypothetical protein
MEDINAESLKRSWKSSIEGSDSLRYSQSLAGYQSRPLVRSDNQILIENHDNINDSSRYSEVSEEAVRLVPVAQKKAGVRLDFSVGEKPFKNESELVRVNSSEERTLCFGLFWRRVLFILLTFAPINLKIC